MQVQVHVQVKVIVCLVEFSYIFLTSVVPQASSSKHQASQASFICLRLTVFVSSCSCLWLSVVGQFLMYIIMWECVCLLHAQLSSTTIQSISLQSTLCALTNPNSKPMPTLTVNPYTWSVKFWRVKERIRKRRRRRKNERMNERKKERISKWVSEVFSPDYVLDYIVDCWRLPHAMDGFDPLPLSFFLSFLLFLLYTLFFSQYSIHQCTVYNAHIALSTCI